MVRKKLAIFVCVLVLCAAVCGTTQAASIGEYEIYETCFGVEIPSKVLEDFKGIISKMGFKDDYVIFSSSPSEFCMFVGDFEYVKDINDVDGTVNFDFSNCFLSFGTVRAYAFGYVPETNEYVFAPLGEIENVVVAWNEMSVVYSNLGDFPELVTRGEKFEILNTFILCFALLCVCVHRIFHWR